MNALKKVFYEAQPNDNATNDQTNERLNIPRKEEIDNSPRRTSGASSVSGESLMTFKQHHKCEKTIFFLIHDQVIVRRGLIVTGR